MKTKTISYVRPWLYPAQLRAIFNDARYGVIEASTKAGKTVGCIVWLTERAVAGEAGQNFWWVAPIYSQAKIAFRRLKRYLPRGMHVANEGELTITLPNGTTIWFKGADNPDSLYGEDVYAAVIDEATRCKEDAWHAVRSTLTATGGPLRIIGNVKGRRNWAYQLARKAEAGEQGMHYAKLTAWDAVAGGVLSAEEIHDAERVLPREVFRELYLAEPSDDGGNPFGIEAIRAMRIDARSTLPAVAYGLDLAKSQDWSVLYGLDANGRECVFDRWQGPWRATIARVKQTVGRVPCLVDSTGVGDPVLEELQAGGGQNFTGYKFSQPSKQQLMEGLAVALQKQEIGVASAVTIAELEAFEYEYTRTGVRYSAPSGVHDDCVMALALARQCAAEMGRAPVPFAFAG